MTRHGDRVIRVTLAGKAPPITGGLHRLPTAPEVSAPTAVIRPGRRAPPQSPEEPEQQHRPGPTLHDKSQPILHRSDCSGGRCGSCFSCNRISTGTCHLICNRYELDNNHTLFQLNVRLCNISTAKFEVLSFISLSLFHLDISKKEYQSWHYFCHTEVSEICNIQLKQLCSLCYLKFL